MGIADRAYMGDERPGGFKGTFSGLKVEVEPCPDCSREDTLKGAAVGGALGFGLSLLTRGTFMGRLIGAGLGAAAGALASRYHLYMDWDPDRVRYGENPPTPPAPPAPESH